MIQLFGELNHEHIEALIKAPDHDVVVINSPGGSADLCRAAVDLVRLKRLCTVAIGEAASAAVPILCSGEVSCMLPEATVMVHRPSISFCDGLDAGELEKLSDGFREFETWYFDTLLLLGVEPTFLSKVRAGGDWTLSAHTAREIRIVNTLVERRNRAPGLSAFSSDVHKRIADALNTGVDTLYLSQ